MNVKGTERRGPAAAALLGDALRRGERELVGPPKLKGRKRQSPVEGRADQGIARGRRSRPRGGALRDRRASLPVAYRLPEPFRRYRRAILQPCLRLGERRRADRNADPRQRADLGAERGGETAKVMGVDPALQEASGHGKPSLAAAHRLELDASEPAIEDVVTQFRAQPLAAASPGWPERRNAGTAQIDNVGIGFVIHVHGPCLGDDDG